MAIRVTCPDCHRKYDVDTRRAGTVIPCKSCGADMAVPGGGSAATGGRNSRGPGHKARRGRRGPGKARLSPGALAAIVVGGVLAVAGVGIAAYLALGGPADEASPALGPDGPRTSASQPNQEQSTQFGRQGRMQSAPARIVAAAEQGREFPISNWRVRPDPPAEPLETPAGQSIRIPVPKELLANQFVDPPNGGSALAVGYLAIPGSQCVVWDLRRNEQVGAVNHLQMGSPVLSPTGRFLAGYVFRIDPARSRLSERGTLIWDVRNSRSVGWLPLRLDTREHVGFLGFGGEERLLVRIDRGPIEVYDLPQATLALKFEVPHVFTKRDTAVSPGGRYLVHSGHGQGGLTTEAIYFYDLTTGKPCGTMRLPLRNDQSLNCQQLAFSSDGTELVGVFFARGTWLMCWRLSDGKQTFEYEFGDDELRARTGGARVPFLQCFPGNRRWLIQNYYVFDRDGRRITYSSPQNSSAFVLQFRRPLDAHRMLHFEETPTGRFLVDVPVPTDGP